MPRKKRPCSGCGTLGEGLSPYCQSCARKRRIAACDHSWGPIKGPGVTMMCDKCTAIARSTKPPPSPCVAHYWVLDSRDFGICKKCGARHDFAPERRSANKEIIKHEEKLGVPISG